MPCSLLPGTRGAWPERCDRPDAPVKSSARDEITKSGGAVAVEPGRPQSAGRRNSPAPPAGRFRNEDPFAARPVHRKPWITPGTRARPSSLWQRRPVRSRCASKSVSRRSDDATTRTHLNASSRCLRRDYPAERTPRTILRNAGRSYGDAFSPHRTLLLARFQRAETKAP